MIPAVALALLLPGAVAFVLLDATLCEEDGTRVPLVLRGALAAGLGLGIGSCAFFVALVLWGATTGAVMTVDGVLTLAVLGLWWARRPRRGRPPALSPGWSNLDRGLAAAVAVSAAASVTLFAISSVIAPHGEMDAWTTWNLKSRFLFFDAADWRTPFVGYFGHPDYPFFLPTAVAHGWRYIGGPEQAFPIAVAALFAAATAVLLMAVLTALRGRTVGLLAGLCLLGTPGFAHRAEWLYADVPLGYYMLATCALLAYWAARAAPRPGALAWAGLAAGLTAWTKNEGMLFLAALSAIGAAVAVRVGSVRRAGLWIALGASLPLALLAYYKAEISARNWLVADRTAEKLVAQLLDPSRYVRIAAAFARLVLSSPSLWLALALPLFVILMGPTPDAVARRLGRRIGAVIALVGAGYFMVYVLTPLPLDWLLSTSLDRLVFHLWPSILLAVFLWTATPSERARPPQ